mgnify:CR=1 FL=1
MTDSIFPRLVLTKGREKSLLRRHPWIFSGAVARMEGKARSGETIDIVDSQGKWLARGAYSPSSQIRARVWSFDRNEAIDNAFFERRLQQAQTWREWLAARDGLDMNEVLARPLPPEFARLPLAASEYRRSVGHLFPAAEQAVLEEGAR